MKKPVTITMELETIAQLKEAAEREQRSTSQMAAILITEALKNRTKPNA